MVDRTRETELSRLLRAANTGDASAYRRFLTLLTPHIRAVALSRAKAAGLSSAEAEDIVQEVLLTIHLKRQTWDGERPVSPWAAAITRNKLIDALRRRKPGISVPIDDMIHVLPAEEPQVAQQEEGLHLLSQLIDGLRPPAPEIVRSISLNGASVRDTAQSLQMTEGAVRVALHRAIKTMAAHYRKLGRED